MAKTFTYLDYICIVAYFVLVIGFGIWSSRSKKNRENVGAYFLAGRSMHFIPVAASVFVSNIGPGHFIGLSGAGSASGLAVAGFESGSTVAILLLGWLFMPIYIRSGVFTMPEYLHKRFGRDRIRIYLSALSLLLYIATKISADLFSGALFLKLSLNINLYVSIVILLAISAVFTIVGGLNAVIWTDFIQTIVMIFGAFYLMIKSFLEIGGLSAIKAKYPYAIPDTTVFSNSSCGLPRDDFFNMIRSVDSDYPWTGMISGYHILAIWYFCTDQVIVQRTLAAKNLTHVKASCILACMLKCLPLFLMTFPGVVARILFPNTVGCADPDACNSYCGNEMGCSNMAYPQLIIDLMPHGASGIMLAVMMAALISSLTSIFNSASTIFTIDIWKRLRLEAKEWELMVVGRLFTAVLAIASILWIPLIQGTRGGRLFDYINIILSYLAPSVCAIFLLAVLTKRTNEKGAFWGLMVGLIVSIVRFIWENSYAATPCGTIAAVEKPAIISKVHFLHYTVINFLITLLTALSISYLTKPIPDQYLHRLTLSTVKDLEEPQQMPNDQDTNCCFRTCSQVQKSNNIVTKVVKDMGNREYNFDQNYSASNQHRTKVHTAVSEEQTNVLKKILYLVCCLKRNLLSENHDDILSSTPVDDKTGINTSIDEKPLFKNICNLGAIWILGFALSIQVFFNKYD